MRKRLKRADDKLIMHSDEVVLPGKDVVAGGDDPTVVLQEAPPIITATTLAEEHQGVSQVLRELDKDPLSEDWGEGFMAWPEPAHVLRGPDGAITSVVPLSEIPGVEFTAKQDEVAAVVADAKPVPVPLNRQMRHQLISVLATRLFNYYYQLARDYPGYHPFRDGLPDLPKGAPTNLSPTGDLHPATEAQIYQWIYEFVGARATLVNKNKFGDGVQDIAVRIE